MQEHLKESAVVNVKDFERTKGPDSFARIRDKTKSLHKRKILKKRKGDMQIEMQEETLKEIAR